MSLSGLSLTGAPTYLGVEIEAFVKIYEARAMFFKSGLPFLESHKRQNLSPRRIFSWLTTQSG